MRNIEAINCVDKYLDEQNYTGPRVLYTVTRHNHKILVETFFPFARFFVYEDGTLDDLDHYFLMQQIIEEMLQQGIMIDDRDIAILHNVAYIEKQEVVRDENGEYIWGDWNMFYEFAKTSTKKDKNGEIGICFMNSQKHLRRKIRMCLLPHLQMNFV